MTSKNKLLLVAAVASACLVLIVGFSGSTDGAKIFVREGCIGCHSFKGSGGSAGPDLTAVTKRRSDSWLRSQIKDPKSHNPGSMMPSFNHLSRREISALIRYLKS